MALLFRLRGVPDDEAHEIRTLLSEHNIAFRETSAGFLGLGSAAIWVDEPQAHRQAQQLLIDYQQQRQIKARAQYEADKQAGEQETLTSSFKQNPVQFVIYFLITAAIIYFATKPFFGLS